MTQKKSNAISILCCYAPEDRALYDRLNKHLASLKRLNSIAIWYEEELQENTKGENWYKLRDRYRRMLERSSITLLLISPDFMNSNSYDILLEIIEETPSTHVIPILLRPNDYEDTLIAQLQVLPSEAKPITLWSNHDEAFLDVVRGIRRVMASILAEETSSIKLFRQQTSNPFPLTDETGTTKIVANEFLLFCEQGISFDPYNVIFYKMKAEVLRRKYSEDSLSFLRIQFAILL